MASIGILRRLLSECRAQGRAIPRADTDAERRDLERDRAIARLVDSFLEYDFVTGSAAAFYAQNAGAIESYSHAIGA